MGNISTNNGSTRTSIDIEGVARYSPTNITQNNINYFSIISPKAGSLGTIIRSFKSESTKQIRKLQNYKYYPVWQRNYYDRIIRNEKEFEKIKLYIKMNPENWERDEENLSLQTEARGALMKS